MCAAPEAPGPPFVEVVAALYVGAAGILVQQRPAHVSQPLAWEFPGGKVDPGESPEQALRRECQEELGVEVEVGPLAYTQRHAYPEKIIRLRLYHVRLRGTGTPAPLAACQLAYLQPQQLRPEAFCAADAPILAALRDGSLVAGAWS